MASSGINSARIRRDIADILRDGDLSQLSSKKIRKQLEEKYDADLTDRKKEIDDILMAEINAKQNGELEEKSCEANGKSDSAAEESESDFEAPEDMGPPKKKSKADKVTKAPASDDEEEVDDAEMAKQLQEELNSGRRSTRSGPRGYQRAKKKTPSKTDSGKKKGPAKGTSTYSQPCVLSPVLAQVVGVEQMARSDVVKKMWEIIKARELLDPRNKQFMLCDEELQKLFGRKRVRTFGMMKYLKDHMYKPEDVSTLLV